MQKFAMTNLMLLRWVLAVFIFNGSMVFFIVITLISCLIVIVIYVGFQMFNCTFVHIQSVRIALPWNHFSSRSTIRIFQREFEVCSQSADNSYSDSFKDSLCLNHIKYQCWDLGIPVTDLHKRLGTASIVAKVRLAWWLYLALQQAAESVFKSICLMQTL